MALKETFRFTVTYECADRDGPVYTAIVVGNTVHVSWVTNGKHNSTEYHYDNVHDHLSKGHWVVVEEPEVEPEDEPVLVEQEASTLDVIQEYLKGLSGVTIRIKLNGYVVEWRNLRFVAPSDAAIVRILAAISVLDKVEDVGYI